MFKIAQDTGKSILFPIHSVQGNAGRVTREGIISVREPDACSLLSWFNPSQQLSTTQPLPPSPSQWGEEEESKGKKKENSLAAVVRGPEAAVLEAETQKLDRSLSLNLAVISLDSQSPEKQPLHSTARSARSDDLR